MALLTTPKRGSEMRHELGAKADEVRGEISARAKDAEWVPMFQRDDPTNGNPGDTYADASGSVQEAAADAGSATGEAADQAATDTAEAINESYDAVDRETKP